MSIFIQIASYRDPELLPTVESAVIQSDDPTNFSFGICYQRMIGTDKDNLDSLLSLPKCRVVAFDAKESKGACWARSQTQKLWNKEEYTLQIDSHTRFVKGWDTKLISMLNSCPSSKPVLSTYPPPYTPPNHLGKEVFCKLRPKEFTPDGILLIGDSTTVEKPKTIERGYFLAAGFIFASSHFIEEIPYDPNIYFYGEEINISLRAWSKGWDVFHPNETILYHYYSRKESPKHWQDDLVCYGVQQSIASSRLQRLVGIREGDPLTPFGLGDIRTLSDYEKVTGLDFQNRAITIK